MDTVLLAIVVHGPRNAVDTVLSGHHTGMTRLRRDLCRIIYIMLSKIE